MVWNTSNNPHVRSDEAQGLARSKEKLDMTAAERSAELEKGRDYARRYVNRVRKLLRASTA
ncbi:hypothetical protein [Aquisalimonas sp.]|uniref:hypothetical protein n=1 Tax=Aquisalimonas sp. TaxID=1872621 RepID=UPI0025C2030D|nr:hypothetical protein [Aquisalimonas sp.]